MILEGTRKSSTLLLPVVVAVAGCAPRAYVFEPPPLPAYVYPDGYYTTARPVPYGYPVREGYQSHYWITGNPPPVVYVDPGHRHRRVDDRHEHDGRDDRKQPGQERGRDRRDRDHGDRERNGGDAPRAIERQGGKARSGSQRQAE